MANESQKLISEIWLSWLTAIWISKLIFVITLCLAISKKSSFTYRNLKGFTCLPKEQGQTGWLQSSSIPQILLKRFHLCFNLELRKSILKMYHLHGSNKTFFQSLQLFVTVFNHVTFIARNCSSFRNGAYLGKRMLLLFLPTEARMKNLALHMQWHCVPQHPCTGIREICVAQPESSETPEGTTGLKHEVGPFIRIGQSKHSVECWDAGFNKHFPNFSLRTGTDMLEFKYITSNPAIPEYFQGVFNCLESLDETHYINLDCATTTARDCKKSSSCRGCQGG
ncbi:hypothetical protein EK904_007785 [Melospiza melodia maxima]|nr:hypothetical protein EK904_007785 [Melospiza melodia maxima]